jgi:hypothetical protein
MTVIKNWSITTLTGKLTSQELEAMVYLQISMYFIMDIETAFNP